MMPSTSEVTIYRTLRRYDGHSEIDHVASRDECFELFQHGLLRFWVRTPLACFSNNVLPMLQARRGVRTYSQFFAICSRLFRLLPCSLRRPDRGRDCFSRFAVRRVIQFGGLSAITCASAAAATSSRRTATISSAASSVRRMLGLPAINATYTVKPSQRNCCPPRFGDHEPGTFSDVLIPLTNSSTVCHLKVFS